ncbi:MAG TPA: 3-oxoacyl-[acyl-carrier-protein] synthase III C-terminal domain-containing protein [Candidatus Binatia bacterium]|nr:3-oxoacyl-[acyl-carrier-protein] synthase III C-terminal domain-containing protein [Candidatus Binatia bacterium]
MTDDGAPRLLSLATTLPRHRVTPDETKELLRSLAGPSAERWLATVDGSRIRGRHAVLPIEAVVRRRTIGERSEDYAREAVALATTVASDALAALADANAPAGSRIATIVSVSCTGYVLPSLDAQLVQTLRLAPDVRRLPITELGCSGGVAGLALAGRLQRVHPDDRVLLVSVETCSLCLQVERPASADLLGAVLFGDAAAALVLGSSDRCGGPAILAEQSVLWPDCVGDLAMELTTSGFRFVLSPGLPDLVKDRVRETVVRFLSSSGLCLTDVEFWVVHPGGPKVLDAVGRELHLGDGLLRASWDVWERCGNVSSATVFFILRQLADRAPPRDGALGLMLAFGPGVSCEMLLLRWREGLAADG